METSIISLSQGLISFYNRTRAYHELVTGFHRAELQACMNTRLCKLDYIVFLKKSQHSTSPKKAAGQWLTKKRNVTFSNKRKPSSSDNQKVNLNVHVNTLRLGKFPTALLWEGEVEMPTLSSLPGLWAGNTREIAHLPLSTLFEQSVQDLDHQETLNRSWQDLPCRLASGSCQCHLFAAGNLCSGGENHKANSVVFNRSFWHLLWITPTAVRQ